MAPWHLSAASHDGHGQQDLAGGLAPWGLLGSVRRGYEMGQAQWLSRTSAALVGRERELALISEFLETAATASAGETRVLVIEGDPGVGKTALLHALAAQCEAHGGFALTAAGVESEVDIGFACLAQLLGPVVDQIGDLPSGLREDLFAALGYDDLRPGRVPQVAVATVALLEKLGAARPGVVMVDDLQWVDHASADVLGQAARSLNAVRMLVFVRPGARTYFDTSGFRLLELEPLQDSSAQQLVKASFPHIAAPALARVMADARGNPLALLELPAAFNHEQLVMGREIPIHLPLTERLEAVYRARILTLPPDTRHLLLVAALGDRDINLPLPDWSERLRILSPAERAGLLRMDRAHGHVEFRHPLVRSTVVSLSTGQERRHAHQVLASAYTADGDRAAWHLAAATTMPDEEVASILENAARRAMRRGDAAGAVRTLVRAAELSPDAQQRARRLAEAAYEGADVSGDLRQANELLQDADLLDSGGGRSLEAAVVAAYLHLNGAGDTRTAHRVLVGALQDQRNVAEGHDGLRAEALHTLCEICLYAADPDLWPDFHTVASAMPLDEFPVLHLWAMLMVDPVRTAHDRLPELEHALASLVDEVDPVRIERVATAALFVDRVGMARQPLLRLVDNARGGESVAAGIVALMVLALDHFRRGDWSISRSLSEEGVALCDSYGFGLLAWPLKFTAALLSAATGNHDEVRKLVEQMRAWATPRRVGTVLHYAHHATALDALGKGDYESAYRAACAVSPPGQFPANAGHTLWTSFDLVEAAVRAGHGEVATAHVKAMEEAGVAMLSSRLSLLTAGSRAIATTPLDRALYERALATVDAEQWPFELARIKLSYGQRLRRDRAPMAARQHLESALETFERLGARPWAERAEQEVLATSPSKQRRTFADGPLGLTSQEHQVAILAAQGMSNRQIADRLIISARTVGAHLERSYRKLGVSTRAGLYRALAVGEEPADGHGEERF